jgi:hypothetical protein
MGYISYKTPSFSVQTGAGADMNASGANGLKAFFNISFSFGSSGSSSFFTPSKDILDFPKVDKKKGGKPMNEGEMDQDQVAPKVLEPEDATSEKDLKNPEKNIDENSIYNPEQEVKDEAK